MMEEDLEELDDDLECEDEHIARMRELSYWSSDAYDDDGQVDDTLIAFARDDPDDE